MNTKLGLLITIVFCLTGFFQISFVSTPEAKAAVQNLAPNGPGMMGVWSRPDKEGFLATMKQNVWATISEGILNEVYYPRIDTAQTKDTQLLFVIGGRRILEERKDFIHKVRRYPGSLAFHVSSFNPGSQIHIEKDIALDPLHSGIVLSYEISLGNFTEDPSQVKIYVLHNPAADNTAGGDAAYVLAKPQMPGEILAYQSDRRGDEPPAFQRRSVQLLVLTHEVSEASAGFEGVNDPWTQLHQFLHFQPYDGAVGGNVAAAVGFTATKPTMQFRIALEFGLENQEGIAATAAQLQKQAQLSLHASPSELVGVQQQEWQSYLQTLNPLGRQFENHVLVMRGLEDKLNPGAIIAGPSLPSLPGDWAMKEYDYESARLRRGDANGGYHRVWPRDATQMALGFLAVGDTQTPVRIARYLARIQLPSGHFPQNTWVDGTMSWTGFQIDQTGFPIILVSRLVEMGLVPYSEFRGMVVNAADAIVQKGPWTQQDRWEENGGLSPNSIAIACQGLMEASWLEASLDQARSHLYQSTCEKWTSSIWHWTYVTNGPLGSGYFERMEVGEDPNHSLPIHIGNDPVGGSIYPESAILDGGFVQLIISGLLNPLEPRLTSSLNVYDQVDRAPAGGGLFGYIRYNHDGYGTDHVGKTWPLLSGERALAAIERHEDPTPFIRTMLAGVTPSGMACEQTGVSACPLGWGHAEILLVERSLLDKRSFYIPQHLRSQGYWQNSNFFSSRPTLRY